MLTFLSTLKMFEFSKLVFDIIKTQNRKEKNMIQYAIFDENRNVVDEFETVEEGLEALKNMNDGEIRAFLDGYYTDHYELMQGKYSRVFRGRTVLKFKDDAKVESISKEHMSVILSQTMPEEVEELIFTLDSDKARTLYDGLAEPSIVWNAEERTITVEFYCLETEDTMDADMVLYYKCAPFVC